MKVKDYIKSLAVLQDKDFSQGRKYIGASDMGVLAGLVKGKTPFKLWEELTGKRAPFEGNERTEWGRELEPMVIARFIRDKYGKEHADRWLQSRLRGNAKHKMKNGVTVLSWSEARYSAWDKGVAHADAVFLPPDGSEDPRFILEVKTTSIFNKRDSSSLRGYDFEDRSASGIPMAVYLQCQWQMLCYQIHEAWVACLMGGQQYGLFGPIRFNAKVAEKLLARAQKLWRHVEADEPVMPGDFEDVQALFPEVKPATSKVVQEEEFVAKLKAYHELKAKAAKIKAKMDDIKRGFEIAIEGAEYLEAADGRRLASQVQQTRETLDSGRLKAEAPEIFEKYKKTTHTRFIRVASWKED